MSEPDLNCEACHKPMSFDEAVPHIDVYLCQSCTDRAMEAFAACTHDWSPTTCERGDGFYCSKCSCFVEELPSPAAAA